MKHLFTILLTGIVALMLGAVLGARHTILNAHIYPEHDVILLEIFGQVHSYGIDG